MGVIGMSHSFPCFFVSLYLFLLVFSEKGNELLPTIQAYDKECIATLPYLCHNISQRRIVLRAAPELACWTPEHKPYAIYSFLCLLFYVPTAIFFVPSLIAHVSLGLPSASCVPTHNVVSFGL